MQKYHQLGELSGNSGLIQKDKRMDTKWEQKTKICSKNRGSFAKKLDEGGRKIKDMNLEEMLLEWATL